MDFFLILEVSNYHFQSKKYTNSSEKHICFCLVCKVVNTLKITTFTYYKKKITKFN